MTRLWYHAIIVAGVTFYPFHHVIVNITIARTFLPSSLGRHQKSCTSDNPMIKKSSKDESYTSRAGAKVSYPKLKSKEKANRLNENEHNENDVQDEGTNPSKEDLINLIKSNNILTDGKLRSELFTIIDNFLKENKLN